MKLTGVSAHGVELAEALAILLVRHGYAEEQPQSLDELLSLAKKAKTEPHNVHVLLQEGGSSQELYLHWYDSAEDAENARVSCSRSGAYRTSPAREISGVLAQTPGFYEAVEAVAGLSSELELADVPDDEGHE